MTSTEVTKNVVIEALAADLTACEAKLTEAAARITALEGALKLARLAIEGLAKIADPNQDPSGVMNGPTIAAIDAALLGNGKPIEPIADKRVS